MKNCATWNTTNTTWLLESNNVPEYYVPPYCPFGVGQGYCQSPTVGNSTNCTPFMGRVCPCVPNKPAAAAPVSSAAAGGATGGPNPGSGTTCPVNTTLAGDVLTPVYQRFEFPLEGDPTAADLPKHMYNNTVLKTGNTYQVIGALLNGIQVKGPAEANGFNVDTSLIPLPCGGHVTPPVGPGPVYHYHKAADCLASTTESPGSHSPLIGYAADGFGIYGFSDYNGQPVLDECNGHFGPTPPHYEVKYHYHAQPVYNLPGQPHKPYYMGCQGPSKGKCNSTVSKEYDDGANWCGEGCGYDLCAQPGVTTQSDLESYLDSFTNNKGAAWLGNYSINDY